MNHTCEKIPNDSVEIDSGVSDQKGFILIVGMLALCLLSLMGIWALSTSDYEFKLASNLQTLQNNANISEGGAFMEGAGVGFARTGAREWYQISDPNTYDQFLLPPSASYDPGGDIAIEGTFPYDFAESDYDTWPRENMMENNTDNTYDYAYLTTYLYPDSPPKGYDVNKFSGYKFRIRGHQKAVVEIGGIKVGVKASS